MLHVYQRRLWPLKNISDVRRYSLKFYDTWKYNLAIPKIFYFCLNFLTIFFFSEIHKWNEGMVQVGL